MRINLFQLITLALALVLGPALAQERSEAGDSGTGSVIPAQSVQENEDMTASGSRTRKSITRVAGIDGKQGPLITSESKTSKSRNKGTDPRVIFGYVDQLNDLNQKFNDSTDQETIDEMLLKEDRIVSKLLERLRTTNLTRLPEVVDWKQISFLNSRKSVNESRGNKLATERDRAKLAYFNTREQTRGYLEYLIQASDSFKGIDEVVEHSVNLLSQITKEAQEIKPQTQQLENSIYQDFARNHRQYHVANASLSDILNHVINNPTDIVRAHWFQRFNVISTIAFFNKLPYVNSVNQVLAPIRIDVGGIIVSLGIVLLIVFWYPLVIRGSGWLIERYLVDDNSDHDDLILNALNKPVKSLLLFASIDLATNALLYKTEIKASLDKFYFVIYTWVIVWMLFRLMDAVLTIQYEKLARSNKELRKELINLGAQFIKGILFLGALAYVLNRFGISIAAIMSTLGIGGLAFALAAKDSLSNLFGGVTILFDNVFKMGDWVKIDKVEGTVVEIGLRSTTIRTFDNALITIPNALVSVSSIQNWNRRSVGRRIKMFVGVTYDSNMQDIQRALADIRGMLSEHPDIANPAEKHVKGKRRYELASTEDAQGIKSTQLVFLDRYGEYSIDILIYCFSKTVSWAKWLGVKEDVLFRIADILEKNNLEFAFPTEVTIVKEHNSPSQRLPLASAETRPSFED